MLLQLKQYFFKLTIEHKISFFIIWIVVPSIILSFFIYTRFFISKLYIREDKISAESAFWAGLILSVIIIIYFLQDIKEPSFTTFTVNLDSHNIIISILSIVLSFILYDIPKKNEGRGASVIILIFTCGAISTIFLYIFISKFREMLLFSVIGISLGVLLHTTFFPKPTPCQFLNITKILHFLRNINIKLRKL